MKTLLLMWRLFRNRRLLRQVSLNRISRMSCHCWTDEFGLLPAVHEAWCPAGKPVR